MKCSPPIRSRCCTAAARWSAAALLLAAGGTAQERALAAVAGASATVARQVLAMGTLLDVAVTAADVPAAEAAAEAAVQAVEAAEARLSTWRDDSELARLNGAPVGQPLAITAALRDDLAAAQQWWRATDGAFDPAIGALIDAYDLRGGGRWPSPAVLRDARGECGFDGLELTAHAARRVRPVRLDAGAFGKGAALADAGRAALAAGATTARFDFGGQRFVAGALGAGAFASETVTVADPRDRQRAAVSFSCAGRSVATSADSERRRLVDGRALGHLLDPRTGAPAGDLGAVTVVADDPLAADCLSTALYVLGAERALAWAEAHDGVEALVLERRGDRVVARATAGLRDLVALHPDIQLR